MWFGKNIIAKLGLALAVAVPAFSAAVAPLYFTTTNEKGEVVPVDASLQQDYWDELMTFKIWGTEKFTYRSGDLTDTLGAVGSAGNFVFENARQHLGGPIFVGGSILGEGDGHEDVDFLSGPGRIKGDLKLGLRAKIKGVYCVEGSANANAVDASHVAGYPAVLLQGEEAKSGDCAYSKVKDVPSIQIIINGNVTSSNVAGMLNDSISNIQTQRKD